MNTFEMLTTLRTLLMTPMSDLFVDILILESKIYGVCLHELVEEDRCDVYGIPVL